MGFYPEKPDEQFKGFVYDQFSRIGKALASSKRLIILNILCQGEHSVEALARHAGLSVANVSRHLQLLSSVNLVKIRRQGKQKFYTLADEQTCRFYMRFKEFATQRLAEIEAALSEISRSPSRLRPVNRKELIRRVQEEDVLVLDVRPQEEFTQAHLPGAVSIPLTELERRLEELPQDKQIVAYCRGRFCILADKAVELLLSRGFQARRADDGVVEWRLAGLPLEES